VLVTYHLRYDRDVDGSQKVLLDGFAPQTHRGPQAGKRTPVVWEDDRQLVLFAARKVRVAKGVLPYVSVVVRPLARGPVFAPAYAPPLRGDRRRLDFATTLIPPSNNNAYTPIGIGGRGRIKTHEARAVAEALSGGFVALADDLRAAARAGAADNPPNLRAGDIAAGETIFPGALRLRLRFGFLADRRDVDGSSKIILDAARGVLWHDDTQIASYAVAKARMPADAAPRIEGSIWELS
jgi:Holliday junction resolvase RusA-like endonuclease